MLKSDSFAIEVKVPKAAPLHPLSRSVPIAAAPAAVFADVDNMQKRTSHAEHNSNCHVDLIHKSFDEKDCSENSRADLVVSGMGCHNCAMRVRNAILQLAGVNWVDVNLETGLAQVAYDATKISPEQFLTAIATADPEGRHHYQASACLS